MANEFSMFVNAAAIVLIPSTSVEARNSDLMNSLLLAQLVATKREQASPATPWYDSFVKVLGDYWISNIKTRQDMRPEKNSTASPLEWIAPALANGSSEQRRVVMASLENIARLQGSLPAMTALRAHVQKAPDPDQGESSSQSSPVRLLVIAAQGEASMACICLQFNTRQVVDPNPWGQRFNADDIDGCVSAHFFNAHLAETLYAPAREAIARKVDGVFWSDNTADITEAVESLADFSTEEIGS